MSYLAGETATGGGGSLADRVPSLRPLQRDDVARWLAARRHTVVSAFLASARDARRFPAFAALGEAPLARWMDVEWRSLVAFLGGDRAEHDRLWDEGQDLLRWLLDRVPLEEQLDQLAARADALAALVAADPGTREFRPFFLERLDHRLRYARVALNARAFQIRWTDA